MALQSEVTSSTTPMLQRFCSYLFAALLAIVLLAQARLLYTFPQPDSARWWGDETGQMLELRTELRDGIARIPTGLGSSVAVTNGLVRGNSWFAAGIYGVPAILFSHIGNLVEIGRSVTFALSLVLLWILFRMLRLYDVPVFFALFVLIILCTTRAFFFASHAARLDVVASIAVLLFVWYFQSITNRRAMGTWSPTRWWYFFFGAAIVLLATLSIHLLTLIPAIAIVLLWKFNAYRNPLAIVSIIAGAALTIGFLVGIYVLSGAPFSTFGPSVGSNQFQSVAGGLPILRPFSRSVQVANIVERFWGLWHEAPAFSILAAVTFLLVAFRCSNALDSKKESILFASAIAIFFSWLLLQSPALYYYIQVLPLFFLALIVGISRRVPINRAVLYLTMGTAIVAAYFGFQNTIRAGQIAEPIHRGNNAAIAQAISAIQSESSNRPIVLAQNPAIAELEHSARVQLMTPHLVSFASSSLPIPDVLRQLDVSYILLYAPHDGIVYSEDYHVLRPIADSLGTVVLRIPGMLFDVHRDYFEPQLLQETDDTLILYKFPARAH